MMTPNRRHPLRNTATCGATALVALAIAACGSSSPSSRSLRGLAPTALTRPTGVTLVLDFVPNAVHAGIYHAIAAGYYTAENINLRVITPTTTADTLKLIDAGAADFGLSDGIDVASQIDLGRDAEAIMALTQKPLGAPIALAREHLTSAAQLQGKTVGITGVPSDAAVLETSVRHAGGDPAKVHLVTLGFNGVQDLEAGKIAAFTGFWPADGVQLQVNGYPITAFKLDENGGPAYPGLVAFTTRGVIRSKPRVVKAFLAATVRGYADTVRNPQQSLNDLLRLNPALQRKFNQASLNAYLPLFTEGGAVRFGKLQTDKLAALSAWLLQYKLIHMPITPSRYGTNAFLPAGG